MGFGKLWMFASNCWSKIVALAFSNGTLLSSISFLNYFACNSGQHFQLKVYKNCLWLEGVTNCKSRFGMFVCIWFIISQFKGILWLNEVRCCSGHCTCVEMKSGVELMTFVYLHKTISRTFSKHLASCDLQLKVNNLRALKLFIKW